MTNPAQTEPGSARDPIRAPVEGFIRDSIQDSLRDPMESPFIKQLIRQWRAIDTNGVWDGKGNEELLARYIVTKEKRKSLPLIADPDPVTVQRYEMLFNAVGLAIEEETGIMVTPILKMHHEGFGRIVLVAGRLVVINRTFRDLHRFGYEDMERLASEGEKLIADGVAMIRKYPDVAALG